MTDQDAAKIAAQAGVDVRTVRRALVGRTRSLVTRLAVARALRSFGFKKEALYVERERGRSKK